jgi:hypothetical protein
MLLESPAVEPRETKQTIAALLSLQFVFTESRHSIILKSLLMDDDPRAIT